MAQPLLFGPVPQPRVRDPEPWTLYLAVLKLRRTGHRVYRRGRREHVVDGRRVRSGKELIHMATRKKTA